MTAATIERWIKNLGRTYESLISEGIIPNQPLDELYAGRDRLTLNIQAGVEMHFYAKTRRLEAILLTLLEPLPGGPVYKGELPSPLQPEMTRDRARATFGEPMASRGTMKMPGPMGRVGGWDSYRLDPAIHPNALFKFQYTAEMRVKAVVFSLADRGHD